MKKYTGFLKDHVSIRALTATKRPRAVGRLADELRKAGCLVERRHWGYHDSWTAIYVEDVPEKLINKIMKRLYSLTEATATPETKEAPVKEAPPADPIIDEIKRMVNTLNFLSQQWAEERAVYVNTINHLREECARLTAAARRAMVIHGD